LPRTNILLGDRAPIGTESLVKKIGIGLLALIVLLVAGILVAPSFVDWNAYKGRIAAEVRKATGRELSIDGDIGLSLLPRPALSVGNVRLANAPDGSEPTMVALDSLLVQIAALPLLQGRLQVNRIVLVKPTILIEVLPDGRGNWFFDGDAQTGSAPVSDSRANLPGQVSLESLTISEGTVIYRDAVTGREERIADLNAEIAADSLKGPFAVEGEAVVRGIETAFDLSAGRVPNEGASPLSVLLRLPGPDARLNFSGAVSAHAAGFSLRGRAKASGVDLAALIQEFRGTDLPLLATPFTLESDLALDAQRFAATEVSFRQGDMSAEGDMQVSFGTSPDVPPDVQVNFTAQRIDLDKILAVRANIAPETPAPATPASVTPTSVADGFALPQDVTGSVRLAVDALVYRGQVVRQVLLNAALADGRIKLSRGSALLPGGSDVSLTGAVTSAEIEGAAAETAGSEPRFSGRIEAASDNFRAVLDWLGVDVTAVPAARLRRMTLIGGIDATPDRLTLSNVDLRIDVSRMTGGIAIALRERPAFGIGLAVDKVNMDAYWPADALAGQAAEPDTDSPASGDNPAAGPAFLDEIDANLDLRLGSLTVRGVTARDLRFDVTLQSGAAVVREARIGDLAGSSTRISGAVAGLSSTPTFDGSVRVSVPDTARLAKILGIESDTFVRLSAVDMNGTLKGSARDVSFDMALQATGGLLNLVGTAKPTAQPASFDVAVTAVHPDLAKLARALSDDVRLEPGIGGLDITAQVTGTPARFAVNDLAGQIGPTDVSGSLGADLTGSRPAVTVDLVTGVLPLTGLLAPAAGGKSTRTGAGKRPAKDIDARWSTAPIDLSALQTVDAQVKLRAVALVADAVRLDTATVDATLSDGVLDLRELASTFYGGAIVVSGKVMADDSVRADMTITATEMDMKRLLQDLAESDRVGGPLTLNASLTAQGKSEADLIGSLAGKGDVAGTLTVKRTAEDEVGALVLGILGKKIKEIRGLTDATNVLFNAFAGTPAALKGTFTVEKGVMRTNDTKLDGREATALTIGIVDLPAWQIKTRTDVFRALDTDTPYLTAELRGPLDKPNPRISGQPFQGKARPEAPASPSPAAPPPANTQPAPAAPAPLKPEDIIKKGLEGLLKGLKKN
jgi:uncharacterized protein involved in outer membrane biogenesis